MELSIKKWRKTMYRNVKGWLGSLPSKILDTLVRPEVASNSLQIESQLQADGSHWQCSGTLTLIGDDNPLSAAAVNCPSEETAREQVALQLLHQFQTRFLQFFPAGAASSKPPK